MSVSSHNLDYKDVGIFYDYFSDFEPDHQIYQYKETDP